MVQVASKSRVAAFSRDERVDDVIARIAARLRLIRGPLPPVEFDAVAHDIVLEVARFVLEWTERGGSAIGGMSISVPLVRREVEVRDAL